MIGRRLPLGTWPERPGDYMGPISGYTSDKLLVWPGAPGANAANSCGCSGRRVGIARRRA